LVYTQDVYVNSKYVGLNGSVIDNCKIFLDNEGHLVVDGETVTKEIFQIIFPSMKEEMVIMYK
jgi:hypothetical protein